MKKVALIIVLVVFAVMAISSCNSKVCPAYSKVEAERPAEVG